MSQFYRLPDAPAPQRIIVATDPVAPVPGLEGAVVAVGNFDGVHRGHRAVIARAEALAAHLGRPCAVLTFEPHPTDYFRGAGTIFRLTPQAEKAQVLDALGLDGMIVMRFDDALASLPAEDFVRDLLVRRLGIAAVVAGYDFHFGHGREGTPAFLKDAGARHGFAVEIVDRVEADDTSEAASSTATRAALERGDVRHAAHLLGRPYRVLGTVIPGQQLGRTLGFPTANIILDPTNRLRHGIYAVRVTTGGKTYGGVASFGRRPTFDNGAPLFETVLFDFSGDLYGHELAIDLIEWIRGEAKFDGAEALVVQMKRDAEQAQSILLAAD